MRNIKISLAAAAAVALAAGCSSHSSSAPASAPAAASATSPASAASTWPGPFAVKLVSCGPLSAAQQSQYGTNASEGAVVDVTNVSAPLAWAQVTVNFAKGGEIMASNVTSDNVPNLARGQSQDLEVDAVTSGGQPLTGVSGESGCSYGRSLCWLPAWFPAVSVL